MGTKFTGSVVIWDKLRGLLSEDKKLVRYFSYQRVTILLVGWAPSMEESSVFIKKLQSAFGCI